MKKFHVLIHIPPWDMNWSSILILRHIVKWEKLCMSKNIQSRTKLIVYLRMLLKLVVYV